VPLPKDERRLLLDTNSYLRLADTFHPLIGTPFGKPPYTLRVTPELDRELNRNPRLSGKFHWASGETYAADRRRKFRLDVKQKAQIHFHLEFLRETAHDLGLSTSPVDIRCLAYALTFGAIVVTDDVPMIILAFEFGIPILRTIDLLKLMLDQGRATLLEIRDTVELMEYRDDIPEPKEFWKKYAAYFGDSE
jgi:hypothetical protein